MYESPTSCSRSAPACPTTSAAAHYCAEGLQDPARRCPARPARRAEGRRHLRQVRMRWSASRRSSPASTRSSAPASRPRRRSAPRSWRIASRPSRRTRCRSTSSPACSIRARRSAPLDAVIPKDWDIVVGGGHQAYFNAQMRGRPAERYTTIREFGAVGNGLSYALGRRGGAPAGPRRQGRAVRRRRRAPVPHPGARDDQAPRPAHPDLRDERRRLRLGVPQAARRRRRRQPGDLRPAGVREHRAAASACAATRSATCR